MLKILDRIQTSLIMRSAPAYGRYVSEDEARENNRAAGNATENKAEKASDDITTANTIPSNANNEATNKNVESEAKEENDKGGTTSNVNEGSTETDATTVQEADMCGGAHIADNEPGVIDFGFGVKIDTRESIPSPFEEMPNIPYDPNGNAFLDYLNRMQAMTPNIPVQPQVNGIGRHKVDNPQPPKPEVKKAEADQVDVDLDKIKVDTAPPAEPKKWPDEVDHPLPQVDHIELQPLTPKFDNSAITSMPNCRYMADIEKLALECGVQIQMLPRLGSDDKFCGLISCVVYTPESNAPNPYKGFTIDTGMIIDRRAKVFPAIVNYGFEDLPVFPVLVKDESNKGKNVLNEKLFRDLFTGGVQMIRDARPMYTQDFMELNKNVAIITMPTNNMNKEIRLAVRDRLMAAMKAGVFEAAKKRDPNARFRFKHYDKKNQSFTLTNEGVPCRFCGPVQSTSKIEISFTAEGKTFVNYL